MREVAQSRRRRAPLVPHIHRGRPGSPGDPAGPAAGARGAGPCADDGVPAVFWFPVPLPVRAGPVRGAGHYLVGRRPDGGLPPHGGGS
ncbi:hypothetical protein, partial [Actinoalloteichus spitiensis]|uniref:hypothetical protein n=1 Tax=Actinoalloteichus spitiensis TaxID=252394 RepID=UPI001B7F9CF4